MRRILSLVLAMAITLSIALFGGTSVSAESNLVVSDECVDILKIYEGFSKYPYWDYGQWTVGYGTRCPSDMVDHYKANGISEADAENLLKEFLKAYNGDVNYFANKYSLTLTQSQFDALVLFSFNCGSGWVYSPNQNFHKTMAKGAEADPVDILYWLGTWSNAGGSPNRALIRRRICEADMYLNGNYSVTPPEHYGYVIYNAQGGSVTSRIHAYDTSATPITPTYDGHTFMGWFTATTGGYQVTTLDESTDTLTLYARWDDAGTTDGKPNGTQDIDPLKITVTSNYVNLRKGPGTNYATVGQANKGDQYTITQIATGSGHTWGNFSNGWISLTYTNYNEVKDLPGESGPVDPAEPTEPKPTEPEATEPEATEPEATEPEVTEPEVTEPEPTEPEATEPEKPAGETGKVKANGGLNVRSGPGTGYGVVGHLSNGAAVTILEKKTVGSMIWGKTDKGWISMSYVVLDSDNSVETEPDTDNSGNTDNSDNQSGATTGYIKAVGGLNIRSGPGTTYGIVATYSNGTKVTVTQQQTVGSVTWGKTDKGWISMNYFTTEAPSNSGSSNSGSSNSGSSQPQSSAGTIKVDGMLCIRSGPGTSYAVQGYYRNGDKVSITQQQTVGSITWGKTDKGWVSMDYVVLNGSGNQNTESTEPSAETRTVTANCLNVRSSAGTGSSVVGYLYAGTKVQILEKATVNGVAWGKISTGWICLDYTK